jgi:hypothetical protein
MGQRNNYKRAWIAPPLGCRNDLAAVPGRWAGLRNCGPLGLGRECGNGELVEAGKQEGDF